jgi:anti-sigma-K factor RskA
VTGPGEHKGWRADLAAYLLGSLDDDERVAVEQHLEDCDSCREELRWLQPAIDLLPEAVAQVEPPPQLRERLLAEVGSEAAPEPAAQDKKGRRESERRGFLRGFMLRPATGLAALALVAAAIAGYALNDGTGSSGPGTTTIRNQGPGELQAALDRSGDSGTLQLTGLRQAPSAHVYQAWVQERGGKVDPVSLFDARHNGTASVSLDHKLGGVDAVMVTVEPRGGSHQPTAPAVISVPTKR